MSLSRFPHGVSSAGVPILSTGARYTSWWGKTTRFVDYDNGNDGNEGTDPTHALKHLQTAINASVIGDVIYVRNREQDISSTDPEYIVPVSTTNWSVAEAQTHLSIIGASNVSHIPTSEALMSVYLRGNSTATTGPVMDWRGAFGLIENLAWHRGAVTSGAILSLTGNSTSLRALGTVVNNCLFRMDSNTGGSIYNVDNWWTTIYGCTFHDCLVGVYLHGSNSTIRRNSIVNCTFRNQTAASVDTNIYVSGSSTQDLLISGCSFVTNTPTATTVSGNASFINVTAVATGVIQRCSFCKDTDDGTTDITANGLDILDCHQARMTADSEAFAVA